LKTGTSEEAQRRRAYTGQRAENGRECDSWTTNRDRNKHKDTVNIAIAGNHINQI